MTDTLERFADLGLTTDGAYWARWCRRHERLLAEQAAHRAEEAKKPKKVSPNPGDRRKRRNTRLPHAASRALSIGDRENQEHQTPSRVQLPTDRS